MGEAAGVRGGAPPTGGLGSCAPRFRPVPRASQAPVTAEARGGRLRGGHTRRVLAAGPLLGEHVNSSPWSEETAAGAEGPGLGAASAGPGGGVGRGGLVPRAGGGGGAAGRGGKEAGSERSAGQQHGAHCRQAGHRRRPGPGGRGAGAARGGGAAQRSEPSRSEPDPGGSSDLPRRRGWRAALGHEVCKAV